MVKEESFTFSSLLGQFWTCAPALLLTFVQPLGPLVAKPTADLDEKWRRVEFREPVPQTYYVDSSVWEEISDPDSDTEITAHFGSPDGALVYFSNRLYLRSQQALEPERILQTHYLNLTRTIDSRFAIFEAVSPRAALEACIQLNQEAHTIACAPVMRRALAQRGRFVPRPNDTYLQHVWHLDNRDHRGRRLGIDFNARSAWATTRGEGIRVALSDNGIDLDHPDLKSQALTGPHFNFATDRPDGNFISADAHGTAVAGLIAAEADNATGVAGLAPKSSLASLVVFDVNRRGVERIVPNDDLMDMFEFGLDRIDIQNHSWGSTSSQQSAIDALSDSGIENAIQNGRDGKGIVMFRAAGNEREFLIDANDDGFAGDPRGIAVAAVRADGRVTSYSSPGACILIAAPSGDDNFSGVATTDHQGTDGFVTQGRGDLADYLLGEDAFDGTSASSPLAAAVGALILSSNSDLGYRDVQQILIHASRQTDPTDLYLSENAAGFQFSRNTGYGMPDAGFAVSLAKNWPLRPSVEESITVVRPNRAIPDAGYELLVSGRETPTSLRFVPGLPSLGNVPDDGTATVPLVFVPNATSPLQTDLTGRAAVFRRSRSNSNEALQNLAEAGAAFAIVINNRTVPELQQLNRTFFNPLPAIAISQRDGTDLLSYLEREPEAQGTIQLRSAITEFEVTDSLICEHIGVQLSTTHTYRGDLRITLTSPSGTRSVLQAFNDDSQRGPRGWTYWSTKHFYEASAGNWRLTITDQQPNDVGSITSAALIIRGVSILDIDADGLDDNWERRSFGSLVFGPKADPDADGFNNAREQVLQTNPTRNGAPLQLELDFWNPNHIRLSWPSRTGIHYNVYEHSPADAERRLVNSVEGLFPRNEIVIPFQRGRNAFYSIAP